MKRFLPVICSLLLTVGLLSGCGAEQVDRSKELQAAMKANDKELSAAFLENASSFSEVSSYLKGWAEIAGLEVAADKDHYINYAILPPTGSRMRSLPLSSAMWIPSI